MNAATGYSETQDPVFSDESAYKLFLNNFPFPRSKPESQQPFFVRASPSTAPFDNESDSWVSAVVNALRSTWFEAAGSWKFAIWLDWFYYTLQSDPEAMLNHALAGCGYINGWKRSLDMVRKDAKRQGIVPGNCSPILYQPGNNEESLHTLTSSIKGGTFLPDPSLQYQPPAPKAGDRVVWVWHKNPRPPGTLSEALFRKGFLVEAAQPDGETQIFKFFSDQKPFGCGSRLVRSAEWPHSMTRLR
jgi:hypothetical protein